MFQYNYFMSEETHPAREVVLDGGWDKVPILISAPAAKMRDCIKAAQTALDRGGWQVAIKAAVAAAGGQLVAIIDEGSFV